jgi:predicted DsbA family dithiol-disulfide isomerase
MKTLQIDFVSDVACPWCAIGVFALDRALERIGGDVAVQLVFQPFELNPDMPPEGADTIEYLSAKYGIDEVQIRANQARIRDHGAAVGFAFGERARVWNTFDAHRLLSWAAESALPGRQHQLKRALLRAYHGEGRNPGAREVLLELAAQVGLDAAEAARILEGDRFGAEVRAAERQWQRAGIHAVPAVVIDRRHLISGAQTPEAYEHTLRELAARR